MPKVYLPIVETNLEFPLGELEHCEPNAGFTYVNGYVYAEKGTPINGNLVVFSYRDDGPIVASVRVGPHLGYPGWPNGFFSHILQVGSPRQGDWSFWIVDEEMARISTIVNVHTDGIAGAGRCQQALIYFSKT